MIYSDILTNRIETVVNCNADIPNANKMSVMGLTLGVLHAVNEHSFNSLDEMVDFILNFLESTDVEQTTPYINWATQSCRQAELLKEDNFELTDDGYYLVETTNSPWNRKTFDNIRADLESSQRYVILSINNHNTLDIDVLAQDLVQFSPISLDYAKALVQTIVTRIGPMIFDEQSKQMTKMGNIAVQTILSDLVGDDNVTH